MKFLLLGGGEWVSETALPLYCSDAVGDALDFAELGADIFAHL